MSVPRAVTIAHASAPIAIRPHVLDVATATPRRALMMAAVGGGALSVQAFLNGRLGRELGSVETAAAVNNTVALLATLGVALALGSFTRIRSGPPWWALCSGVFGAAFVMVTTLSAPHLGVALLTVALVFGQTAGGLGVDTVGLTPSGRRPVTAPRGIGVGLAAAAVVVGAAGAPGHLQLWLFALAVAAGFSATLQQSLAGHVARATGEPAVAAVANFASGAAILVGIAVFSGLGEVRWSTPPGYWLGGLAGAFFVLVSVAAIRALGVLRLTLALVAGQTLGALVLDVVAPVRGSGVTATAAAGALMTVAAVAVSGRRQPAAAGGVRSGVQSERNPAPLDGTDAALER